MIKTINGMKKISTNVPNIKNIKLLQKDITLIIREVITAINI